MCWIASTTLGLYSDNRAVPTVAPYLCPMVDFRPSNSGCRFAVQVQPRASRTEVVGEHGAALRVRISAPPVDGAANDELIRYLARELGVASSAVQIVSGASGRRKVVEVAG